MMLEQEIEKYLSGQTICNCDNVSYRNIKNLVLGFAEPREKQIQIDAEHIRALQKQNGELTDRLTEAKQFIRDFLSVAIDYIDKEDKNYSLIEEGEQFIKENA